MAMNVFGNPITNSTLLAMPEYEKRVITRMDRARMALNMKNARGNDSNVLHFVENIGKESQIDITTLCVLYNATGDTIRFVDHHDWYGRLAESPWPVTIANGQWAGFVHVESGHPVKGSHGAVVYRGKNESGSECDWMMSWRNAHNRDYDNTVYTEIRDRNHFQGDIWRIVYNLLDNARPVTKNVWNGCTSSQSTGSGYKAVVEAVFSLEHADEELYPIQ